MSEQFNKILTAQTLSHPKTTIKDAQTQKTKNLAYT